MHCFRAKTRQTGTDRTPCAARKGIKWVNPAEQMITPTHIVALLEKNIAPGLSDREHLRLYIIAVRKHALEAGAVSAPAKGILQNETQTWSAHAVPPGSKRM